MSKSVGHRAHFIGKRRPPRLLRYDWPMCSKKDGARGRATATMVCETQTLLGMALRAYGVCTRDCTATLWSSSTVATIWSGKERRIGSPGFVYVCESWRA